MTIIYGIKNCDTVKKAIKWLEQNNISYTFHDFRVDGLSQTQLEAFVEKSTWEQLINKRSTTYRNLSDEIKNALTGQVAIDTILETPTLIKRPVLLVNDKLHLGFKAANYEEIFL